MEYRDTGIKMIIVRRSERKGQFEEEAAGEYPCCGSYSVFKIKTGKCY